MISLELDESDRQMLLLALAHLSIERPGWAHALNVLALQVDEQRHGRALMFDEFRRLHVGSGVDLVIENTTGRPLEVSGIWLAGKLAIKIKDAQAPAGEGRLVTAAELMAELREGQFPVMTPDELIAVTQHALTCTCNRCLLLDPARQSSHAPACHCQPCITRRGTTIVVLTHGEAQRLEAFRKGQFPVMSAIDRIKQAVADAQRDGHEQFEIAGVLLSFAAGYALEIGWDRHVVAGAQGIALEEHVKRRAAQKGSSRS